jgi:hypothetical protein
MTGNLQCEELSDRAGTTIRTGSGYSSGQVSTNALRGSVTAFMCRHDGPTHSTGNVLPPANASKGKCHTNVFSNTNPTNDKQGRLDPPNYNFAYGSTNFHKGPADILAGLAYVNTIEEAGNYVCTFTARLGGSGSTTYRNLSIEFIGWTSGFFSGAAKYYKAQQYTTSLTNQTETFTVDMSYPYLTINLHALSRGGAPTSAYSDIFIDNIMCRKQ